MKPCITQGGIFLLIFGNYSSSKDFEKRKFYSARKIPPCEKTVLAHRLYHVIPIHSIL